jgi:uncharacterized membrane protein YcaP (DUF421 family)
VLLQTWDAFVNNLLWFGTGDPHNVINVIVSLLEKILRPIAVYLALVWALRVMGKRILAQLNPFDLVVLLTLSNTVQNAIIGNDTSLLGGFVGAAALLGVNAVLVRHYYRGPGIEHRVRDDDEYLIREFSLQEPTLRKYHINVGELTALAHERGFDDVHEVQSAVLYPNGTIYMKGESQDSGRLDTILQEVKALRQEVSALRS